MELGNGKDGIRRDLKTLAMLTLAAVIFAVNIRSFINTAGLFPGGINGITILIQEIGSEFFNISIPYSVPYILLNLGPAYLGFRYIGKKFTLGSFYVVFLLSVLTDLLPEITITEDYMLASVFGGVIQGAAVSICLMAGASAGGMDFISIYRSEQKGVDSWNFILAINVAILATAGILFGFDRALWSIVFQFCTTRIINVMHKRYQKDTLIIITQKPMEIYEKIRELTHHDATLLEGIGCYEGVTRQILYSVIGRGQVDMVKREIKKIDSKAFINVVKTEVKDGRFYKTPTR